jgi:hypothetical protein
VTELKPFQKEGVRRIYAFRGRALLADDQGLGKQHPVETKILTPGGWVEIGRLKVGDPVIGSNGRPIRVTGVFPQGLKPAYRLHCNDKSSVMAGPQHLWSVDYWCGGRYLRRLALTTDQLMGREPIITERPSGGVSRLKSTTPFYLPMLSAPVQFEKQGTLPLHPYLVGLLIANGGLTSSSAYLTCHSDDWHHISSKLRHAGTSFGHCDHHGNASRGVVLGAIGKMRDLGLCVLSGDKSIPEPYMRASVGDRVALLHGLMDGDGSISKTGNRITYHTTSPRLCESVIELVECLGGIASSASYENKGTVYSIRIRVPSFLGCPFTTPRKSGRYVPGSHCRPTRRIARIDYVGPAESVCISVDAPDRLYVTEHAILTHNTIQSLEWIRRIPQRRPVVIVTPASLKYSWQAEAALHFGMHAEVIEGRRKARVIELPGDIVIINYEILKSWLPVFLKASPQCVILDEIHYIKNSRAQRTKAVLKLVEGVPSVVGLSGTPMTNRPFELWTVMQAIKPDLFPSMEKFAWRYCRPRYTPWGWSYDGAENLKELRSILKKNLMIRRLKKQVLPELPDKTRKVVPMKLKSYVEYNAAQDNFLTWLHTISPAKAKKAKKSQALTKVGYLLRLVAQTKIDLVVQWVEEFFESNPGKKLVGLTMHTYVIDRLKEKFPDAVFVNGQTTGVQRDRAVRAFQTNPKVRAFFGNWKAAGVGLTLHAAHNIAALDFPWTPGDLFQGEDRIHRIGQKEKVIVHYLMAMGTIEEKLVTILQKKAAVLDAVLNGTGSGTDLDVFDELLKDLE